MESAGTLPRPGISSATAPELVAVYAGDGPFVSLYLDTTAEVENAGHRLVTRWKDVRRTLEEMGAPEAALSGVDEHVDGAHTEGQTLAVVAGAAGLLYVGHEPEPPKRDVYRVASLPSIAPLIEWRQQAPAHVVVLCDRKGADVFGVRHDRPDIARDVSSPADEDTIRKSAPGGWSQRRYQQRAENAWEQTAEAVADLVTKVADRVEARLIVVAGDVRVVAMLKDTLPERLREMLVEVDGDRSAGASMGDTADDVLRMVSTVAAEDTVVALQKFREERGQDDRAADGVEQTVAALQQSRVGVLLVHDDPDDERVAYFGPDGVHVATLPQTLRDMGVDEPQEGRLVDVAIRAALLTGAGVRVVPRAGGPSESLGAILRY